MAFTLSRYIYPLQTEILLSASLGYSLDNPRTEGEIQFVLNYIKPALHRTAPDAQSRKMKNTIWELNRRRIADENLPGNEYLLSTLKGEPDEVLARNWIIIRYTDKGEFDKIPKNLNFLNDLWMSPAKDQYFNTYYQLEAYCHCLNLFVIPSDEYYGHSISLLTSPFAIFSGSDTENIRLVINTIHVFEINLANGSMAFGDGWRYFALAKEKITAASVLLEKVLVINYPQEKDKKKKEPPKNRILYAGDLLRIIFSQSHDLKVKFMLLVSILELLVTHAPDSNKNIEDSIKKQFILKLTILLHYGNAKLDLEGQKKLLSDIYNTRSTIAHGGELGLTSEQLENGIKTLYNYVKIVFTAYVNDVEFVEFLKAN
jgi:hypothetical protein